MIIFLRIRYFNGLDLHKKAYPMKMIYFVLALFFFPLFSRAQQDHFVYLQTENSVPFYIKAENKIMRSSSAGYLIISKLKDGDYKMIIGSPKNEWPEQLVSYKVDKKDAGYIIKNFGDKGLGLFNLQNHNVVMAESVIANKNKQVSQNNDDAFSNMLADVVNDSTIKQKDVAIEPTPEKAVVKEEEKELKEEVKEKNTEIVEQPKQAEIKTTDQAGTAVLTGSVIKRQLRKKRKDGIELVYVDEYENKKDTIRIFIPADKSEDVKKEDTVVQKNSEITVSADTVHLIPVEPQKQVVTDQKPPPQPVFIDESKNEKTSSPGINSDCKAYATEEDFFKLRKKMAAEKNDESMVNVAKKIFKSKCFSTDQIKNLSNLFLNDEGRYSFFDTAYPYLSDSATFSTLESQLSDPYYITRFKAMIRH
jgi:Domain of unknown function (DUF4476)